MNMKIKDERKDLNPDNSTAIPNDLIDKYAGLFSPSKENGDYYNAVVDLIQQSYKTGLDTGRNESPLYTIIPVSVLENKTISANAKLLYSEIMALSKKSGKCYATNEHLANMLGLTRRSMPTILKELKGMGLISVDIQRNKKGTYRNITVSFFSDGRYQSLAMGGIVRERGQRRNRQIEIDKIETISNSNELLVKDDSNSIQEFIDSFKDISPTTYKSFFANTTERKASKALIEGVPPDILNFIITKALPKLNVMPYVPKDCKAFKPSELYRNIDKIKAKIHEVVGATQEKKQKVHIIS